MFGITLIMALMSTMVTQLNMSYIKSKPLGMQTLPDIARCDVLNLSLLSAFGLLQITVVQVVFGTVAELFAMISSSILILSFYACLIHVIIYHIILYLCTFYGGIVSEWNEEKFKHYCRWINIVLTTSLGMNDILFYKAARGITFQLLAYGPNFIGSSHYGPGQMSVVVALIITTFGYQIHLEVASFKSGEKVNGILRNVKKLLSPNKPIFGSQESIDDTVSVSSMRLLTLIGGSVFCFLLINVASSLIWPGNIRIGLKKILILISLITVVHPGAYILSTPKILDHSKRIIVEHFQAFRM